MELRIARQLFFDAKKAEGITARTYQTYRDTLRPFLLYLTDEKVFQVEDVKSAHIRAYIMKHRENGVRNITLHRDFRTILGYTLSFANRECVVVGDAKRIILPI